MYSLSRKRYTRNPSRSFPGTILSRSLSIVTGEEDLLIVVEARAQNVVIHSSPLWLRCNRFVNVVEALRIGRKCEASQVATGKHIGQGLSALDVQQFKCPGSFSSFFDFVQEEPSIRRDAKRFDCRMLSGAPFCRVDQKAIFSIRTFAQIDAGLFLAGKSLAKEIPLPDFLDGIVGLHIQQFANALANAFSAWDRVQVCACVLRLRLKPGTSLQRSLDLRANGRDPSQTRRAGFRSRLRSESTAEVPSVWA